MCGERERERGGGRERGRERERHEAEPGPQNQEVQQIKNKKAPKVESKYLICQRSKDTIRKMNRRQMSLSLSLSLSISLSVFLSPKFNPIQFDLARSGHEKK